MDTVLEKSGLADRKQLLGWILILLIVGLTYWAYQWDPFQTQAVAAASVREAAPLLLGALCGLIGERSGIVNIGIEGQMLLAAFAGFMGASYSESILVGVAAGITASVLAGLFMAWATVTLRQDQIIAGTIVNIFAVGATSFYLVQGRTMPSIPNWKVPFLSDLPFFGRFLFSHGPFTYAALVAVIGVHVGLFSTRWGLRTRAVGEHPGAAATVGVKILRLRYRNLLIAAVFAGLAGLHLIQSASAFSRGMSNGKGFIALAVMLFGRYRPFGAAVAAVLFGFFVALQTQLQFNNAQLPGFDAEIPPQFFGMIPYLLTIIVLAISGSAARSPAAAGTPYEPD